MNRTNEKMHWVGGWGPNELGIGNAELIEGGIRLVEERFRLRSSSYDPTSRMRLEAKELKAQSSSKIGR